MRPDLARKGQGQPLVMVTAYDAPTARAAAAGGVDVILVGDSLGMVVLGFEDTLHVTIEDMVRHTGAVARSQPPQLVVADLPWASYHSGPEKRSTTPSAWCTLGLGPSSWKAGPSV